jgi:DNA-binding transcriptional LysR family regulator
VVELRSFAATAAALKLSKATVSKAVSGVEARLGVNNGDAMLPALIAGTGLGVLPEFILRGALDANRLERVLPDWSLRAGAVYWVTPPGGPRPKRLEVLADFHLEKFARPRRPAKRSIAALRKPRGPEARA